MAKGSPEWAYEAHTDVARSLADRSGPGYAWMRDAIGTDVSGPFAGRAVALYDRGIKELADGGDSTVGVLVMDSYDPAAGRPGDYRGIGVLDDRQAADDTPGVAVVPSQLGTDMVAERLANAPTYYVTHDMVELIEYATSRLDSSDVMPTHPELRCGFVVLARPIELKWTNGRTQHVRAFFWNDVATVRTSLGTAGMAGWVVQFADRVHGEPGTEGAELNWGSKSAYGRSPELIATVKDTYVSNSPVGDPTEFISDFSQYGAAEPLAPQELSRFQPYLASFMLMLNQQIVAVGEERQNDFAARRAQRTSGARSSTVTVVDLRPRKHSSSGGEGSGRKLETRHVVRMGKWRWQTYGPNNSLRKRIFVSDYIRGPEDAPLVVKPRVHRL